MSGYVIMLMWSDGWRPEKTARCKKIREIGSKLWRKLKSL